MPTLYRVDLLVVPDALQAVEETIDDMRSAAFRFNAGHVPLDVQDKLRMVYKGLFRPNFVTDLPLR